MNINEAYTRLYELCKKGLGSTSPNPNVSAAIYSADGKFIAEGFHNRIESPDHAEVIALKKAGESARGATIVVSLEPCSHHGTTPPCTQAIIDAGISKVYYAVRDPNPIAAGGGEFLKNAGIEVEYLDSPELHFIQRAWLHKITTGYPLLIWKVATSLDSKIAALDGSSQWISNEHSRNDVQQLRAESDAILIGTQTAIIDNPHLVPRGSSKRPVRVVCGEQVIPPMHHIFDNESRTLLVQSKSLPHLMETLASEGFNQVLVEAGPTFGSALFRAGWINELITYQAPILLGAGKEFISDLGISTLGQKIELKLLSTHEIYGDLKTHYQVGKGK